MRVKYLGYVLDAELLTELNDYQQRREQCLRIRRTDNPDIMIRWEVSQTVTTEAPTWLSLRDALKDVLMPPRTGIINRIKRRLRVRKHAKYLTDNAKGASAKSLRRAINENFET